MAFSLLPDEVVERIFAKLDFTSDTTLAGSRLWESESNKAAMSLALCSRRNLRIFSSTISGISMDFRFHFGSGLDRQVATLISIAGVALKQLVLNAVGKQVGPRTCWAIFTRCPNISSLQLSELQSFASSDIARIIARTGKHLQELRLTDVYAGDDVLNSVATHCGAITKLWLENLNCDVSSLALQRALVRIAPTVVDLNISNVLGRGLSSLTLAPACAREWPALTTLRLCSLEWLDGPQAVSILIDLGSNAPNIICMHVSRRSVQSPPLFSEEQVAEIRNHLTSFAPGLDGSYGFGFGISQH
jgi:hypothetical protein